MSAATNPAIPLQTIHRRPEPSLTARVLSYLPQGNLLDDEAWRKRHTIVWYLLVLHLPALTIFGLCLGHTPKTVGQVMVPILVCLTLERLFPQRRPKSFFTTAGIVYCSAALVGLSRGSIEAHFHFFIIIGFIALYQDWVPFLWNIVFTVLSHGFGSAFGSGMIFNHHAGMEHPWTWSFVHGIAVLAACIGVVLYWRTTEEEQQTSLRLTRELGEAAIGQFTSQLLVNLARRNQGMLYRQLDILNQLEEKERDPDALAELFRLDHLATRIRRNAESFLVLAGEEPARVWSNPVPLFDVVRAAIAETEDLERVGFMVDQRLAVHGGAVTDLTHLLAELTENAVQFSPPGSRVTIRSTPDVRSPGVWVLTVEDQGIGILPDELAALNALLKRPRTVEVATSQRLGLQVVARLAHRHSIEVALTSTSVVGITAVVLLPAQLFAQAPRHVADVMPSELGWRSAREAPGSSPASLTSHPDLVGQNDASLAWNGWLTGAVDLPRQSQSVSSPALEAGPQEEEEEVRPEPVPADPNPKRRPAASIQLSRRTPQASLAPELRGGKQVITRRASAQVPAAEATRARDALSRYQTSRRAALIETGTKGDPR